MSLLSIFVLFLSSSLFQDEIPLKPDNEYELKLNFELRNRPPVAQPTVDYVETQEEHERKNKSGTLPFLKLKLTFIELSEDEVRVRVTDNLGRNIYNKKAVLDEPIDFDLGFTDDLKDHVGAYEFDIFLLSSKRKETSRIHLLVNEDGGFMVNSKQRGKL